MFKLEPKDIMVGVILVLLIVFSQGIDTNKNPSSNKTDSENDNTVTTQSQVTDATTSPTTPVGETVAIDSVVDGDTVKVHYQGKLETVRLLLIDSPESVHPTKPVQPFGKDASMYLKALLKKGETVQLEVGNPSRDDYGRLLGYIWVDGELLNERIVSYGYARVAYIIPPNTKYLDELLKAQEQAQERKTGIWSIEGYVTNEGFSNL